jgi:hypothetical protein
MLSAQGYTIHDAAEGKVPWIDPDEIYLSIPGLDLGDRY